jgi:hypothetical protein
MFAEIDPERLAYQGLMTKPDSRKILYDPLHTELRSLAALFDTRYMILPLSLEVRQDLGGEEAFEAARAAGGGLTYRASLLVALLDIRVSAVIWHGEVKGAPGTLGSGALLATLAQRFATALAE